MNELVLRASTRDAYLEHLGLRLPEVTLDLQGLTRLHQAHLHRVPFHNLELLIAAGRPYEVPSLGQLASDNARGIGGTCHRTTPPFCALLASLGFDVALVAGCVSQPGDHLLGRVILGEASWIVDVGNGHPYPGPFPLSGRQSWSRHGWSFTWDGTGASPTLWRHMRNGSPRKVYEVDPTPRAWSWFEEPIRSHHEQPGFGPFMGALRAARCTRTAHLTVRDDTYTRSTRWSRGRRRLTSPAAAERVLCDVLELAAHLVKQGLETLAHGRPDLFGPPTPPRILVALAVTRRTAQLRELLDSLEADRRASGVAPEDVEVIVLANEAGSGIGPTVTAVASCPLTVHVSAATDWLPTDAPARELGLIPQPRPGPLDIASVRHALVRAIHAHQVQHPHAPWVVWVLDDDMRMIQLVLDEHGHREERARPALAAIRELYADHPEICIAYGSYLGDPPIPGFATWEGQVSDLTATLLSWQDLDPDTLWKLPDNDRSTPDYYYDHTRTERRPAPFLYAPPQPMPLHEAFETLARAFLEVPLGRQVTRPLTLEPPHPPRASTARGGNTVILSPDALWAAPFPSIAFSDGVVSRRGDLICAILAERVPGICSAGVDLPLMHGRRADDGSSPMSLPRPSADGLLAFSESQARGTALGRCVEAEAWDRSSVEMALRHRRDLHVAGADRTRRALASTRSALREASAWWHRPRFAAACTSLHEALDAIEVRLPPAPPEDDRAVEELADFLASLESRAEAWRHTWL